MKKILLTCAVIAVSLIQTSAQCLMYPVLLSQRVPQASLIIEGKVISQQSFWNAAHNKIYTSNLIDVYKTFKNLTGPYLEVITEGGIVGNDKHVFEPSLELEVGDVGIFTLNQSSEPSQFGKTVYDAYASAQGFIKYDIATNTAAEPFNTYQNLSTSLYSTIAQYTGTNYTQIKPVNPFLISTSQTNSTQAVTAISSFSPTTITAGTFSVLTINGTAFPAVSTPSLVGFKNADDGGATNISPIAADIISWSTTQIQVRVPSKAGTGVIRVNGINSTGVLTIPYSHINVTYTNNLVYNTKHINQTGGGYTWTYNTAFNSNAPAKAAFQRSLQSWRCATYINWPTSATTSTISASVNDGTNIVTFNGALGAGILGQCGSYFSGCSVSGNFQWYVTELDIQFANTPGGGTWQYGTAAPSGSQYDFESVTVHELGHGHQLGHVINSTDLMHYAISNGQSKRTLNTDDLNGGLAVMVRNAQAGGTCGQPLMTPLTAGNCALGAPTANFTANRTTVCPGQTVAFTNLSTGTPTAYAWTFAGGTPATSAVANPTITYNTPGTYSVQLVASNANGSNTYTIAAYINVTSPATLPLSQTFQTATFPPTNWYIVDAGNDNVKWKLATTAGYSSTQSTVFDNWTDSITPTRDELKTYVNLSGFSTAKMTFYRSYSQTFAAPYVDTLQIGVSTNCGTSTTYPYLKGGSQLATATTANSNAPFTPTATTQWVKDSVDLTAYVGQSNVMVSFINRGHYGDAIYLDNINITGVAATTPTAAISSASTGCTGTPITLTDASTGSPSSWTWTMTGGTPSSATTQNTSVTYTTAGVKTITLTVANSTGTTTTTKSITITATPTVAASVTNTTICSGSSVVETVTGATTYTWLPTGSGSTSTLTPASTTIYTITGSTAGCTSAPRTVTINVTPTPTTNVTASSLTICAGQSSTLTASGGVTYSWMPGSQTTTVIVITPTTTTTYTATGINGACSSTKTITINVNATPTVSTSITNTTICRGNSVNVAVTGATTYTWLPSGSGSSSTLSPTTTTIYTVTGSNGSCASAAKNFTINVTPTPTVNATATSTSICTAQTITLTASGATTYTWSPGALIGATVAVTPTTTTTYTVNGTASSCSSTKTITINVNSTPTVSTSITNTTICRGASANVAVTGATTYTWLPSGSGSSSTLSPTTTTVYTVTGSNGSCVSTPKNFTITVTPTPTTNVTASSSNICSGQSVTLTASGATLYSWMPGAQTTTVVVVTPTTSTTYTVSGSNGTCSSTKTITVNVSPIPTISASTTNTTICNGSSFTCTLTGACTYTWMPGGFTGAVLNVSPSSSTTYTATGSCGGCNSAPQTVVVNVTSSPVVSSTVTNVTCFGSCNGAATITATGGTAPYAYSLVQGTPICAATTCTNLCAGTYTVNVTDANGCTGNSGIMITQPAQLAATISNTNASCSSCTNGAANVLVTGGVTPYTYMWIPGGQTTPSIINLAVGCYTAQITDNNGCSVTATTCISFGTSVAQMQNESSNLSIYPNPSSGIFAISNVISTEKFDVIITNTLGQTVMIESAKNASQVTIDLSKTGKGIYYAKVTTDEGTKLFKLILE
ncbi:MAG: PKD domain-containing protein [Bacteroidota bacterium]